MAQNWFDLQMKQAKDNNNKNKTILRYRFIFLR